MQNLSVSCQHVRVKLKQIGIKNEVFSIHRFNIYLYPRSSGLRAENALCPNTNSVNTLIEEGIESLTRVIFNRIASE